MSTRPWLLAALLCSACASPPRPALLGQADAVSRSPGVQATKSQAPTAYYRGEKLRQEAAQAFEEGKTPIAEVRAERAIVAYQHGQVLGRISSAEQQLVATGAELKEAQSKTTALEGQRLTVATELKALDDEIAVEREAEAIAESKATTYDRELSRKQAAKTVLLQARLLCVTAELLQADKTAMAAVTANITKLEAAVAAGQSPIPLNESLQARSACQAQLTLARRAARTAAPQSEASDRLFVALSEAGHAPSRDERGIVVTLPPTPKEAALRDLARLAIAHEQTPLLVVVHERRGEPSDKAQGNAAAKVLTAAGVTTVRSESAGGRLPVAQGLDPNKLKKNERLEVVFVTRL